MTVVTRRALDAAHLLTAASMAVECSFGTREFHVKVAIQWTVVAKGYNSGIAVSVCLQVWGSEI